MAAEAGAGAMRRGERLRGLLRSRGRGAAYARAAGLGLLAALALAALALAVSERAVREGIILLFQREYGLFWLAGLALAVATGALAERFALRARPDETGLASRLPQIELPTTGLLPGVAAFGGVLLVSIYHNRPIAVVAPALLALTIGGALAARYHLEDDRGAARRAARTAHVLLTHGVAFLVLAAIYINKVRSLLSATAVALVACLLLLQIADGERFPAERRLIYGLAGGVILGEITWALNYWPLTGWTGGAVLLIAFYLVAGLILAQARTGLRRRDLLEYGAVSAIGFAIVALALK